MTGIEKITGRIEADARAEAAAITAEANAKCAEIRAEYDKKAQDEYWTRVRAGVKVRRPRAAHGQNGGNGGQKKHAEPQADHGQRSV